jgi:hypothetical protein
LLSLAFTQYLLSPFFLNVTWKMKSSAV